MRHHRRSLSWRRGLQEAEQKGGLTLAQEALRRLHAAKCLEPARGIDDEDARPGFEAAVLRMLVKATATKGAAQAHAASAAGAAAAGEADHQQQEQQQEHAREMADALALAARRVRETGLQEFAGAAGDAELLWFAGTAWNAALEAQRAAEWTATSSLFSSSAIFQCAVPTVRGT